MSTTVAVPPGPSPSSPTPDRPSSPPLARMLLNAIPNIVVFGLLGTVMYFGHHMGWKLPKMSALFAQKIQEPDDWCAEHLVPESQCVECQSDLSPKPKSFGFCREHGVMECVIHHPELAQTKNTPLLPAYDTVRAIDVIPRLENNSRNTLHTRRIQFTSTESVNKSGVDVAIVDERHMSDAVTANGELMFDPTHVAHLSARVSGTIAYVVKTLGDPVESGDLLALVDSAQVGQAKSQFLESMVQHELRKSTVERLRKISASGAVAGKSLIEAETALKESQVALISVRQLLANLGLEVPNQFETDEPEKIAEEVRFVGIPSQIVALLPTTLKTANLIPIRAPNAGVIVASDVVAGEVVDTTRSLFTIVDPTRLWLIMNVRQEDAKFLVRGLPVSFDSDDGAAQIKGAVAWISPAVDEQTRTLRVRVDVSNTDGKLRDKTFGTGRIILRDEPKAIVVPRESVQSTADAHFVFVRDKNFFDKDAPKLFHVRQVRIGARDDDFVELLAGVLPGEVVASKGSAVLMAQLLRSNLGAGCGCHDH